jgi:serine/threonine protein kinase
LSDTKSSANTVAAPEASTNAPTPSASATRSGPQTIAGRYEIVALLGVGGMGAVYKARDRELDETVALKMLRHELMNDDAVLARFRQEVRLARRVTHKNVARTFDIGEHGGEKFLTMEFVDGESLADRIARTGRMALAEMVPFAEAICQGLAAAHAAGVVHRDLKPENILVAKDGRVVITDFGIARAAAAFGGAVRTQGVPIGTPAYMAPEQVEAKDDIDARADIYALGAILYELLTGERAWEGDSVYSVAARRLVVPPPDPRAKVPDVPDGAVKVVLRCMARNREDRYPSATDVAQELAALTLPAVAASPRAPLRPVLVGDTQPGAKTVAVLPFKNGGPPEDDYLADGLTDDLIDSLSMTPGLKVRSRGVVRGLKGAEDDPRTVGTTLGVQVVIEGSVRRAGERLRISARVVSVADGFQLWAKRFDSAPGEFLTVSDETVKAVAEALSTGGAPKREAPTDPIAIDLFLRARHEYQKNWASNVETAIGLFEKALERAPDEPMILSGYAMALMRRFSYGSKPEESGEVGRAAATRALAAAPHLGEARVALAAYLLNIGDAAGAARETRAALATAPSLADAHDLCGRLLVEAGALDEGIAHLRTARISEPRLAMTALDLARALVLRGDREESEEVLSRVPEDAGTANLYWVMRGRLALWTRDTERAKRWHSELVARGNVFAGALAMLAIASGQSLEAPQFIVLQEHAKAPGSATRRRSFFGQVAAEIRAFLGDADACLAAMDVADSNGLFDVTWLDRCPLLDFVHGHERFASVKKHASERARGVRDAFGLVG